MTVWPRILVCAFAVAAPALAQTPGADVFVNDESSGKIHSVSGFVCPAQIGHFERDAVGERDVDTGSDFCAYSARDGLYGTITLTQLKGPYDPKAALVPDFVEQEGIGDKMTGEGIVKFGDAKAQIPVYTRTYESTHLGELRYRMLFAGSAVGNWAVQVTMEFASPRDDESELEFLNTVYASALAKIGAAPPISPKTP